MNGDHDITKTVQVLYAWLEGDSEAFHNVLIRAVSAFFSDCPGADPTHLINRLEDQAPNKLRSRLKREAQQISGSRSDAAVLVMMGIYNRKLPRTRWVAREVQAA